MNTVQRDFKLKKLHFDFQTSFSGNTVFHESLAKEIVEYGRFEYLYDYFLLNLSLLKCISINHTHKKNNIFKTYKTYIWQSKTFFGKTKGFKQLFRIRLT